MKSTSTVALSFGARDLLARLVRANASLRRGPKSLAEPFCFHNGRCVEVPVPLADVCELLHAGLIQRESCGLGQSFYRASKEGKRKAGSEAVADAAKSAASY